MTLYGKYSKRMFPSIVNFDKARDNKNILKLSSKPKTNSIAHEEKMKKLQTMLPYAKLHYLPFESLVIQKATSSNSYQVLPNQFTTIQLQYPVASQPQKAREESASQ